MNIYIYIYIYTCINGSGFVRIVSTVWVRSAIASDIRLHLWLAKLLMNCLQQAAFGSTPLCAMWLLNTPRQSLPLLLPPALPMVAKKVDVISSCQSAGNKKAWARTSLKLHKFSAQHMGQKDVHLIVRSCSMSLPSDSHCDLRNTRPDSSPR